MASFRALCQQGIRPIVVPDVAAVETIAVDINWPDAGAGIAVNDVIQLIDLPANLEVVDWKFMSDDIDSNATPTVAFTLGVLNAGRTAIGAGATDAWTAAGGITCPQTACQNTPSGATAANHFIPGRVARAIGLVATAAAATAQLANRRALLILDVRNSVT